MSLNDCEIILRSFGISKINDHAYSFNSEYEYSKDLISLIYVEYQYFIKIPTHVYYTLNDSKIHYIGHIFLNIENISENDFKKYLKSLIKQYKSTVNTLKTNHINSLFK